MTSMNLSVINTDRFAFGVESLSLFSMHERTNLAWCEHAGKFWLIVRFNR